jgi:heat shock protein 1/8
LCCRLQARQVSNTSFRTDRSSVLIRFLLLLRVEIIANDQGNRTTPSYVAFNDTERLIGDAAKNQVAMNPYNTVFDAKRLIGRKFADADVQADMKHWPYKIIDKAGKPVIQVEYKGETKEFVSNRRPAI